VSKLPMFDFWGMALALMRRILYLGTRTQVFPDTPEELGLRPDLPVCYVLDERHLSNLLVLDHECGVLGLPRALHPLRDEAYNSQRSFFFLSHNERGRMVPNPRVSAAPMLKGMVRAAFTDPRFDVQLVPVTILWGREPGKQDSVLKALLAESWQQVSTLRHLLAMLIHGRHTMLRFSAPISLREFLSDGIDEPHAVRKLGRILRVHFRRQREMAIGPDLSHRHTQLHTLLSMPSVRAAIMNEARDKSIPLVAAQKTARDFAFEIASDYSYSVIKAFALFLTWVWNKVYNGIEVHNFDRVTAVAPGHGVIYVPCHRSHADYLLLSYIIFTRGLMVPHIAAGSNLNLPWWVPSCAAPVPSSCAARSRGDPLYAAVFEEYLHLMIDRGFPIEYFIEGTRSRSGRTLTPKAGILAMTVQSFVRSHARPLVFVPVYIGYEKLMEGGSYIAELARPAEKIRIAARTGTRRAPAEAQLRPGPCQFRPAAGAGRVPRGASSGLAQRQPEAQAPWVRRAVDATATELARRINSLAVVNPVNLLAVTSAVHAQARRRCETAAKADRACPVPAGRIALRQLDRHLRHALRRGDRVRPQVRLRRIPPPSARRHDRAEEKQAALLAYFRNNVLHLLALPALLACLVSHNQVLTRQRAKEAIKGIYGLLRAELFLPWDAQELDEVIDRAEAALIRRGLILESGQSGNVAGTATQQRNQPGIATTGQHHPSHAGAAVPHPGTAAASRQRPTHPRQPRRSHPPAGAAAGHALRVQRRRIP
jgi:glycerol-3-phosphate O-acyltransferase